MDRCRKKQITFFSCHFVITNYTMSTTPKKTTLDDIPATPPPLRYPHQDALTAQDARAYHESQNRAQREAPARYLQAARERVPAAVREAQAKEIARVRALIQALRDSRPPRPDCNPADPATKAYIQAIANDYARRGGNTAGTPLIPNDDAFPSIADAHRAYYGVEAGTFVLPFRLHKLSDYDFRPRAAGQNQEGRLFYLRPRVSSVVSDDD